MRDLLTKPVGETQITTACLLAAGTGSRLRPLTNSIPKCLTEIDDKPILEWLVSSLRDQGFKRLVVVVGYLDEHIRRFLKGCSGDLIVEYVQNPLYLTTNNIYSLWLAGREMQEPFLLIESDLIFEPTLLKGLLIPDKIAVSRVLPWMNGTTISMNSSGHVASFIGASAGCQASAPRKALTESLRSSTYKTVNICSLSRATWSRVFARLEQIIADGRVNEYYEVAFAEMVADGSLSLECVLFGADQWYEVDKLEDLPGAERIARQIAGQTVISPPTLFQVAEART